MLSLQDEAARVVPDPLICIATWRKVAGVAP
jgi:hypothetical protein